MNWLFKSFGCERRNIANYKYSWEADEGVILRRKVSFVSCGPRVLHRDAKATETFSELMFLSTGGRST